MDALGGVLDVLGDALDVLDVRLLRILDVLAWAPSGPEGHVTALLMTEKNNVYYRHATRAARRPGERAALVFNLDCADLTEEEVQGHFKTAIKKISNS